MATTGEEARFPISIPVQTDAREAAASVDALRQQITGGRDAAKDLMMAQRALKGSSDEVKAARDQIRAAIEKEKQAVSDAIVGLHKQGTSYAEVAKAAREAAKAAKERAAADMKATGDALRMVNGRAGALLGSWRDLRKQFGEASTFGQVAIGAGLAAAAVVLLTGAVIGLTLAAAKWVVAGASANRQAQLFRETVTSTAADAQRLGNQVEAVAGKVPLATEEVNALAVSLRRSMVTGQTLVDTLHAVAQAKGAGADSAASKIEEIISRGRLTGRTGIGWQELFGTGLDFNELASELAKGTNQGVQAVRSALMMGQVPVGAAAAALRGVAERKFGAINLEKMFSLEGIEQTWSKVTRQLTKGVDFRPFAKDLQSILSLFDQQTVTGRALGQVIGVFGNEMIGAFTKGVPLVKAFVQGFVIGVQKVVIWSLQGRNSLRRLFGGDAFDGAITGQVILDGVAIAVKGVAIAFALAAGFAALFFGPFIVGPALAVAAVYGLVQAVKGVVQWFSGVDWSSLGANLVNGIVGGITSGVGKVVDAVKGLSRAAWSTFTGDNEIKSPAKRYVRGGVYLAEGTAGGVEKGTPRAVAAVSSMSDAMADAYAPSAAEAPSPRAGGSLGGGGGVVINVSIDARGATKEGAAALRDPSLFAPLVRTLEQVLARPAGVPSHG